MQKIIFIFLLFFITCSISNAQTFSFYRVSPAVVLHDTSSFWPVQSKAVFKNLSAVNQSFKFIRIVNYLPGPTWSSQICVGGSCYPDFVDTCPPFGADPIIMSPGQHDTLFIDVLGLTPGTATIVMKAFVLSNPSQFIVDTFRVQLVYSTGVKKISSIISDYKLEQNYPNPFNPMTIIHFSLPQKDYVSLKVYNILGMEVANLLNFEQLEGGSYSFDFNANNYNLSSGVYIYKLQTTDIMFSKKMVLTK